MLTVRDLAATREFYRRVLGMEVVTFGAGRTALRFGDQKMNLHEVGREFDPKAARPTPGSGDLCFLTREPLTHWVERLRTASVAIEAGPVKRTGARGPIESIYLRDPDGNLLEIANEIGASDDQSSVTHADGVGAARSGAADPLAPLRDWLRQWQTRVRLQDYAGGRALCAPDLFAFGTRAEMVAGRALVEQQQWRQIWPTIHDFTVRVDEARGAVEGDRAWVAAPWDSRGGRADGSTFARSGRLTIVFERRDGRWLAVHTHFSLSPQA